MDAACGSKSQIPKTKSQAKDQILTLKWRISPKRRDLEERTFRFAESVRAFVKQLPENNQQRGRCSAVGARIGLRRCQLD